MAPRAVNWSRAYRRPYVYNTYNLSFVKRRNSRAAKWSDYCDYTREAAAKLQRRLGRRTEINVLTPSKFVNGTHQGIQRGQKTKDPMCIRKILISTLENEPILS